MTVERALNRFGGNCFRLCKDGQCKRLEFSLLAISLAGIVPQNEQPMHSIMQPRLAIGRVEITSLQHALDLTLVKRVEGVDDLTQFSAGLITEPKHPWLHTITSSEKPTKLFLKRLERDDEFSACHSRK